MQEKMIPIEQKLEFVRWKLMTIGNLLIKKGLFTQDEYDDEFKKTAEANALSNLLRDFDRGG